MKSPKSLSEQADEILKQAESKGLLNNFFFKTTFQRYTVQLKIMNDLQKQIDAEGATVTKEYVKGRKNLYTNPAISEYNKTATAANGTVATLINIIKAFSDEGEQGSKLKELVALLNDD